MGFSKLTFCSLPILLHGHTFVIQHAYAWCLHTLWQVIRAFLHTFCRDQSQFEPRARDHLATGNARISFIFHPVLVIFAVVEARLGAIRKGGSFSVVRAFVVPWTESHQGLKQPVCGSRLRPVKVLAHLLLLSACQRHRVCVGSVTESEPCRVPTGIRIVAFCSSNPDFCLASALCCPRGCWSNCRYWIS